MADTSFIEAVYRFGGTSLAVVDDSELKNLVPPPLRADFIMWERYRFEPGPPLTVPITTFGGDHDERTPVAALEVWDHHSGDGFTMLLLERNHSFVQDRRTR